MFINSGFIQNALVSGAFMMAKKEYANMTKDELGKELANEVGSYAASTLVKRFGYVMGSVYGSLAAYNLITEDMENAGKWLLSAGVCILGVKVLSHFQRDEQKNITEIKTAMGNLESRVE